MVAHDYAFAAVDEENNWRLIGAQEKSEGQES